MRGARSVISTRCCRVHCEATRATRARRQAAARRNICSGRATMLTHSCFPRSLPAEPAQPALSSWSNGDRTNAVRVSQLAKRDGCMTNSSLAPLYRSRHGVFFLQSHALCQSLAKPDERCCAPGQEPSRRSQYLHCHRCFAAAKTRDPSSKQSWLAENTRQQTAAPLPADLFTAVIYHHAFTPHTVRIPAGAAASAPARAGTACQAREHTGTRDGHGE